MSDRLEQLLTLWIRLDELQHDTPPTAVIAKTLADLIELQIEDEQYLRVDQCEGAATLAARRKGQIV